MAHLSRREERTRRKLHRGLATSSYERKGHPDYRPGRGFCASTIKVLRRPPPVKKTGRRAVSRFENAGELAKLPTMQNPDIDSAPDTSSNDAEPSTDDIAHGSVFGSWLGSQMDVRGLKIPDMVAKTGITYAGIYNIVKGNTKSPRPETRAKLAEALNQVVPASVEKEIEAEATPIAGLTWTDFTPSDLGTVPAEGGVYVFYDVTDRPVYVGKSDKNVRSRVKDHQTRFWFKEPLVVRGAFLKIDDADLCVKIETILIKFLGKHALLNVKGATKDLGE